MWPAAIGGGGTPKGAGRPKGKDGEDNPRVAYLDVPLHGTDRTLTHSLKGTCAQQMPGFELLASGELREHLSTLDIEVFTGNDGGERVLQHIRDQYSGVPQRSLPRLFEEAVYLGHRGRGESQLSYTAKKVMAFQKLDKAGCPLADLAKGMVLLRHANLTKQEADAVYMWLAGDFSMEQVCTCLRRLDRPHQAHGPSSSPPSVLYDEHHEEDAYVNYTGSWDEWQEGGLAWDPWPWDGYEHEWAWEEQAAEDYALVEEPAGVPEQEETITEEEAYELHAQMAYPQSRHAMNKDRLAALARGYTPSKGKGVPSYSKGKGKPSFPKGYKGKSWSKGSSKGAGAGKSRLLSLIARTKCNLRGQVGHWQRNCPMGSQQSSASASSSARPAAAFFICRDELELRMADNSGLEKKNVWFASSSDLSSVNACVDSDFVLASFIGLTVEATHAVLDTGAQSAVVGRSAFVHCNSWNMHCTPEV
eukprot:2489114-Amphidinium_carterae.1